jgi:hypothetical protein
MEARVADARVKARALAVPGPGSLVTMLGLLAYAYSLVAFVDAAVLGSSTGPVVLVPLVALALGWGATRRAAPPLPIHDRQVDYIVGIALLLGAAAIAILLPVSRGAVFWLGRLDVLGVPLFVAGLVTLFCGVRRAWVLRWACVALLLAWPPLWRPLLAKPVALDPAGMVLALAIVGIAGVRDGRRAARLTWLALTLLAALVVPALARPAASAAGVEAASSGALPVEIVALAVAGAASFVLAILLGLRFPMRRDRLRVPADHRPAVARLGWAAVIGAVAAVGLLAVNLGYTRYAAVVDNAGNPARAAFDGATPTGWSLRVGDDPATPRPAVDDQLAFERRLLVPPGPGSAAGDGTVVLDVLSGTDANAVGAARIDSAYGLPHERTISRLTTDIGAGVPAEVRTYVNEARGTARSVIAWSWPVRAGNGIRFERIALVTKGLAQGRSTHAEAALVELARRLAAVTAAGSGTGAVGP